MREVCTHYPPSLEENICHSATAKLHVQGYQWKNLHYLSQASEPQDPEARQKALFEAWKVPHAIGPHTCHYSLFIIPMLNSLLNHYSCCNAI